MQDVKTLQDVLSAIESGEALSTEVYPVIYEVNQHKVLLAEPRWLQNWELTYPESR